MSYVALKSVKFDRLYETGEAIPEDVIDPKRVGRLIACGKISPFGSGTTNNLDSDGEHEQLMQALELEVENHKKTSEKLAKEKETTKKLKAEVKAFKAEIADLTQEEETEPEPEEVEEEVEETLSDKEHIQSFEDVLQEIEDEERQEEDAEEEVGEED